MSDPCRRIAKALFAVVILTTAFGVATEPVYSFRAQPPVIHQPPMAARPPHIASQSAQVVAVVATPTPTPTPTATPTIISRPTVAARPVVASSSGAHEDWLRAAGIPESDWTYVDYIVTHESGWRYTAVNPSSGATGLCQSLPGSKMASAGSDYLTNPITQLRWCNSYALSRYGSWYQSYIWWVNHHWW